MLYNSKILIGSFAFVGTVLGTNAAVVNAAKLYHLDRPSRNFGYTLTFLRNGASRLHSKGAYSVEKVRSGPLPSAILTLAEVSSKWAGKGQTLLR